MSAQGTKPVSDETFESSVFAPAIPVLVDFWATWCPPCRALAPVIEEIAREHQDLSVLKLDVDANPKTAARFRVQSIPTLILFKDGQPVERIVGFLQKEELVARFKRHLSGGAHKGNPYGKFVGG